jgi:hypothetical protein
MNVFKSVFYIKWQDNTRELGFCSSNPHFPWFCAHFIGSTETSVRALNFPGIYICVLSTQFHDHAFKLNINWPSAIILSTFTWKYERKYDFRL